MTSLIIMELSFPSELGYEVIAREAVAAFARCNGFPAERIADMKTVLGEACINAIEHGNMLQPGLTIEINCSCDSHRLLIDVIDAGLKHHAPERSPRTIEEKISGLGPMRGMGMMLIDGLSDESYFVEGIHAGNCLRIIWYLHSQTSCSLCQDQSHQSQPYCQELPTTQSYES